jgi:hypothetical protein
MEKKLIQIGKTGKPSMSFLKEQQMDLKKPKLLA